jgi:hypothetical protein
MGACFSAFMSEEAKTIIKILLLFVAMFLLIYMTEK